MQFSFYGARLKVKRAYKHIDELETWFRTLVRENIDAARAHKDSTPGCESDHVMIGRPKGFSEVVSPIVGDAVHNLRTALDFIAAEILKNEPEAIREISYFPLGGTRNDLISSPSYGFIQRAAPDLALIIADVVKPYKAGGDARFNAINALDRMDKHRVLVPSMTISNHIVIGIATVWNVSNAVCKEMFEAILLDFTKSAGAGKSKCIVLQLDNAGWHGPENLAVPDGIRLVFQPSQSPELQPSEHLWEFVDEPLVNTYFETIGDLEKVVSERCVALTGQQDMIRASTLFHWWPSQAEAN